MPTLAQSDLNVNARSVPPEMRTYQVLCDSCERETIYLSGPHLSGSEGETSACDRAERMSAFHIERYHGHRVYTLMHTQNTPVATAIYQDQEVRR